MTDDQELWCQSTDAGAVECWMMTCCAGAELRVIENGETVLRELYPTKSDLYERARALEAEYRLRRNRVVG
jgi:hypothetical protein